MQIMAEIANYDYPNFLAIPVGRLWITSELYIDLFDYVFFVCIFRQSIIGQGSDHMTSSHKEDKNTWTQDAITTYDTGL